MATPLITAPTKNAYNKAFKDSTVCSLQLLLLGNQ